MPDPDRVRAMFGRVAPRYDLLNRLLSAGIDRRWRRRCVELAGAVRGRTVVDVAAGTGDLALALARAGARVVGVDFTPEMLAIAARARPLERGLYARGDALHLPIATHAADAATIAFGLRNVADRARALAEMTRIVRPGGRVLVLEFGVPRGRALGAAYRAYFTRVLPRVGGLISGDAGAYRYLPETVLAWPGAEELRAEMAAAGLARCGFEALTGGIAYVHFGDVPGEARVGAARE